MSTYQENLELIESAGYTMVPNAIYDYWLDKLNVYEALLLFTVVRKTLGWRKTNDVICTEQIMEMTQLKRTKINESFVKLEQLGLVTISKSANNFRRVQLNLVKLVEHTDNRVAVEQDRDTVEQVHVAVEQDRVATTQKKLYKENKKDINKDISNDGKPSAKPTKFKPVKPESVSEQVWNDLLILRKETKASNSQTAWTTVFSGLAKAQQATGHSLDQIITFWIGKAWKGFNADWYLNAQPKPQQTNYQGNNHANHQSANHSNQPKQSSADAYAAKLAEQRRQREAANITATGSDRANVYDMEETF